MLVALSWTLSCGKGRKEGRKGEKSNCLIPTFGGVAGERREGGEGKRAQTLEHLRLVLVLLLVA